MDNKNTTEAADEKSDYTLNPVASKSQARGEPIDEMKKKTNQSYRSSRS